MAYTNIDDPSAYFQTALYTGNATDNRAITYDGNTDMQPDFLWFKTRSTTENHALIDSNRGITKHLRANTTSDEKTKTTLLKSFDSNGFTLGIDSLTNSNGNTLVSWGWKANGGTTSSNTSGTITSTVQANTTAGFSIVTYTGNGSTGQTIGHGLGVTPDMMIVKNRSGLYNWAVYHKDSNSSPEDYYAQLNTTNAFSLATDIFGGSAATSTVIGVKNFNETNASGSNYVAYCFASKQGYSKFGKYVGNGDANGPFVYTGFKPAFLMIKRSSSTSNWSMFDNARGTYNSNTPELQANTSSAENSVTGRIDLLSNGFKMTTSIFPNDSGVTFIYMAFAENPFTTSTGIPTTAR
jgi:hypothetical protein